MSPHQGRTPEGNVVAGDDQGTPARNPVQPLDVEIEERAREEPGEPGPEGIDEPGAGDRFHRELGPAGGERDLLLRTDRGRVQRYRVGRPEERACLPLRVPPIAPTDL